jgi:imidazolonepropionase-like amidohydrolase
MGQPHYLFAGWLFDGNGGPPRKRILFEIVDGKISAIRDNCRDDTLPCADQLTDLSCCTILPPFIDAHVHLALSGATDSAIRKQQLQVEFNKSCQTIRQNIHDLFTHGILAVRDCGDNGGHALRYKKENLDSAYEPVLIQAAGSGWYIRGRYGRILGCSPTQGESLIDAVATRQQDADFIKIFHSGPNNLQNFARPTNPQFSLEELRATTQLAEKYGRKIAVHANGQLPVQQALEAGCHSIEHGYFMGQANLERMASQQVFWVPTLHTMHALAEERGGDNQKAASVARQTLQHQLVQVRQSRELGVPIALGTDAGSIGVLHGESLVKEIKLLMAAGFSLSEAVQCATTNGAALLGLENMGTLRPGKPATFLVARASPAMLPRKLAYLEAIYLEGRPCSPDFFRKI